MQKSTKKVMKKRLDTIFDFVLPLLLFCGAAGIGTSLLKDDFSRVAIWWLVFLVLGVVAYPVAGLIFGRFLPLFRIAGSPLAIRSILLFKELFHLFLTQLSVLPSKNDAIIVH